MGEVDPGAFEMPAKERGPEGEADSSLIAHPAVLGGTALLLAVGGFGSYFLLLFEPTVRATAWPTLAMLTVAVVLGVAAVRRHRRWWTIALATVDMGVAAMFLFLFFVGFSLPAVANVPTPPDPAPDFELADQEGRSHRLSEYRGRGPVLLVFYRGHW